MIGEQVDKLSSFSVSESQLGEDFLCFFTFFCELKYVESTQCPLETAKSFMSTFLFLSK